VIEALIIAGIIGFTVATVVASLHLQSNLSTAWRKVAGELGLESTSPSAVWNLQGKKDGFSVSVSLDNSTPNVFSRVVVDARSTLPPTLVITPASMSSPGQARTGDAAFDRVVDLRGDSLRVSILTQAERDALASFLRDFGGEVRFGTISCRLPGQRPDADQLKRALQLALDVARSLTVPPDVQPDRLRQIALTDPNAEVRARTVRHLFERASTQEVARAVAKDLLNDPEVTNLALRLAAAKGLGGREAFEPLRKLAEDPGAGPIAAEALQALVEVYSCDKLSASLVLALKAPSSSVRRTAVKAIAAARHTELVEEVCRATEGADAELLVTIADALGHLRDPRAEPILVSLLRDESEAVRHASARALGELGSAAAVEPLLALTKGFGGSLKQVAQESISRIQARLGPADTGRLSMSEHAPSAGALSVPQSGGELAVAERAGSDDDRE
jgi:HEAT repeat protein